MGKTAGQVESRTIGVRPVMAEYERVYTVNGYWDGPRSGVADFRGRPHYYESVFDETVDDYSDFVLRPVTEETFQAELELWEMYTRWYRAHDGGDFQVPRVTNAEYQVQR